MMRTLACVLALALSTVAFAQESGTLGYGEDARSHASDEEIRVARRAYRAACQQIQSYEYCECMTGGMAQSLVPADLRTATALLAHNLSNAAVPDGLSRASIETAQAASGQYEPLCRDQRR